MMESLEFQRAAAFLEALMSEDKSRTSFDSHALNVCSSVQLCGACLLCSSA